MYGFGDCSEALLDMLHIPHYGKALQADNFRRRKLIINIILPAMLQPVRKNKRCGKIRKKYFFLMKMNLVVSKICILLFSFSLQILYDYDD